TASGLSYLVDTLLLPARARVPAPHRLHSRDRRGRAADGAADPPAVADAAPRARPVHPADREQLRRARRRAAELDREPESGGGALLWRRRRARLRARARDARRPARAARARRRAETFPRSCDRLRDCGY